MSIFLYHKRNNKELLYSYNNVLDNHPKSLEENKQKTVGSQSSIRRKLMQNIFNSHIYILNMVSVRIIRNISMDWTELYLGGKPVITLEIVKTSKNGIPDFI